MLSDEEKTEEYFNRHKYAHDNRNGKQETIHKKIYLDGLTEGKKECGKDIEVLTKENAELKEQIAEMKNFVKSMYEVNKNDAYCREYLGTILNEWS